MNLFLSLLFKTLETGRPAVSIKDLLRTVRLDKIQKVRICLLKKFCWRWTASILKVLLLKIESDMQIRKYRRAVCYEAAALICEDNLDFDTAAAGQTRGENQQAKAQSLRRIVNHTIADLTGKKRNRIKLV